MDTARQIIRWSIPGWSLFLLVLFMIAVGSIITALPSGNLTDFSLRNFFNALPRDVLNPTLGLLLGFAGIPIGYFLYQFYFLRYWRGIPLPFIGWMISEDRGSEVLAGVTLTAKEKQTGFQIDLKTVPRSQVWRLDDVSWLAPIHFLGEFFVPTIRFIHKNQFKEGDHMLTPREIAERMEHNWAVALTVWYRFAVTPASVVDRQVTYMFDIYHSQGAVAVVAWVAFVLSVLYEILIQSKELDGALFLTLLVNLLIALFVFKTMTSLRRGIWREITYLMNWTIKLRNQS